MAYLGLNGLAAVVAYLAADDWQIHAGLEGKSEFWRVLLVSTVAMAVIRSSFAVSSFGDRKLSVGPAFLLDVFMRRAERSLDQEIADERLKTVTKAVEGLTYAATRDYLLAMSKGALRSPSKAEVQALDDDVTKVDSLEVDDATKMQLFAIRIIEATGLRLFTSIADAAKARLADEIKFAAEQAAGKRQRLAQAKTFLFEKK